MKDVIIRDYKIDDREYIEKIIREAWDFEKFSSIKMAKKLSKIYLANCLGNQTFIKVAEVEKRPVGIIMMKNLVKYRISIKDGVKQFLEAIGLCFSKEGREIAKAFSKIDIINKVLLKNREKDYSGELAFFAIDKKYRGYGIGKKLLKEGVEYFKKEDIEEFYLYTDSTCNYGFYESQGLKRCGQTLFSVPLKVKNEMEFFIYEGKVSLIGRNKKLDEA